MAVPVQSVRDVTSVTLALYTAVVPADHATFGVHGQSGGAVGAPPGDGIGRVARALAHLQVRLIGRPDRSDRLPR